MSAMVPHPFRERSRYICHPGDHPAANRPKLVKPGGESIDVAPMQQRGPPQWRTPSWIEMAAAPRALRARQAVSAFTRLASRLILRDTVFL